MKTWAREQLGCHCGRCRKPIKAGQWVCTMTLPAIRKKRFRCETCEPPPPDVPQAPKLERVSVDLTRFGLLPLEREPGQEG
jgi:hypothetical protein